MSQKAESVSGLWFLESAPCWGAPRPLGPATCPLPAATTWPDTVLLPVPVYTVVLRSLRDKYIKPQSKYFSCWSHLLSSLLRFLASWPWVTTISLLNWVSSSLSSPRMASSSSS